MRTYRNVLEDDAIGWVRHDWQMPKPHDSILRCYACQATLNLETRLDEECWASLKKHMRKCKSASQANDFLKALHLTAENLRRRVVGPALPIANDPDREATAQSGLSDEYADPNYQNLTTKEQARR